MNRTERAGMAKKSESAASVKKIMDNCELSCARGYEGIVYLRDILLQYFSNQIGPARKKIDPNTLFVFAYSGKGFDSERKKQGRKRKIVLVLRQARLL